MFSKDAAEITEHDLQEALTEAHNRIKKAFVEKADETLNREL